MRCRQRGAALVVAIFLIVVLALLGAVAVRLTAVQQQTVNLSLLSERALLASRTGIQWASHRAIVSDICAPATTALTESALNGFTVAITCNSTTHSQGPKAVKVWAISSFASAGTYGQPDYVSRRLQMVLTDAN